MIVTLLHPYVFAVLCTTCSTRSFNFNNVSVDKARIVPRSLQHDGITLYASPASILVIEQTPLSNGDTLRDTILL